MSAIAISFNWTDQGTSFRMDVMSLVVALALHVPLYFVKFDAKKKSIDHAANRLVSVDLIDPTIPAPPPPPVAAVKENSLMQKLKMMVRREPPPPPPPPKVVKAPEQLNTAPAQIKIQANLKLPEPVKSKLETKSGFKTTADAKLIEEKQISLKAMSAGIAPLSEKKFGVVTDRGSLKSDKGNFKIASNDSLKSIEGGESIGISGGAAPTIAIQTGGRGGSVEKFSAPAQKADKGKLGAVGAPGLGGDTHLGLRDQMIARDASASQINIASARGGMAGGVPGGVEGGVPGGVVGSKRDVGRFQGGQVGGVLGGTGSTVGGVVGGSPRAITAPARPVQKKSMFTITGPLSNRSIVTQVTPDYPAWAQAQGIEAAVVLEFSVLPDGAVKEDIVVRRTSGYPQLDQSAIKALRRWKFAAVQEDRVEVGQITFNFSLR